MELQHDGREPAKWTFTTESDGAGGPVLTGFKVQLVPAGTWFAATSYSQGEPDSNGLITGVVELLVKGPDYPPTGSGITDDGLGALVTETCQPRLFCLDNPDLPIRSDQNIEVIR